MQRIAVGLVGASGYSGMEATRILANHPGVELRFVASDRWQGELVADRLGIAGAVGQLRYSPQGLAPELTSGCALILLATPAEASLELAPRLLALGCRVIDLSGAFRLQEKAHYPSYYGFNHSKPELLSEAVYGSPELFGSAIAKARLVANPGCFATTVALSLGPLLKAGLIEEDTLIVDSASGVTGAGRKATEEMSFTEVDGDFRAYRVLRHQHTPEMTQTLSRCAGHAIELTFTPHLLPLRRGILSTIYARLKANGDLTQVKKALAEFVGASPFLGLRESPEAVTLKRVLGTNRCELGVAAQGRQLVLTAALDNLVKGAAGQAVQNLNLMLGFDETTGLADLRGFAP